MDVYSAISQIIAFMNLEPVPLNRHVVAAASDLPVGTRKIITIGRRVIGVFNVNGELYALRNVCPHRSGPVCTGRLRPLVTGDGPHGLEYAREGEILRCPWHQWEFDIKTGQALYDDQANVKTYRVAQERDEIVVYL